MKYCVNEVEWHRAWSNDTSKEGTKSGTVMTAEKLNALKDVTFDDARRFLYDIFWCNE